MKFFNAKVGDGKKTVRMVCFNPALHSQFLKCESERTAMSMSTVIYERMCRAEVVSTDHSIKAVKSEVISKKV